MNFSEFEAEFAKLGSGYKTKDLDRFNRILIKNRVDVSFLGDHIPDMLSGLCPPQLKKADGVKQNNSGNRFVVGRRVVVANSNNKQFCSTQ